MTYRKFDPRRNEIDDYWNGSACDERHTVRPYLVIGIVLVVIVAVGVWGM